MPAHYFFSACEDPVQSYKYRLFSVFIASVLIARCSFLTSFKSFTLKLEKTQNSILTHLMKSHSMLDSEWRLTSINLSCIHSFKTSLRSVIDAGLLSAVEAEELITGQITHAEVERDLYRWLFAGKKHKDNFSLRNLIFLSLRWFG